LKREGHDSGILGTLFSRDPALNAAIIAFAAIASIALVITLGPIVLAVLAVLGIGKAIHWYVTLPEKTTKIAQAVDHVVDRAAFPQPVEFFEALYARYEADCKQAGVTPPVTT